MGALSPGLLFQLLKQTPMLIKALFWTNVQLALAHKKYCHQIWNLWQQSYPHP